MASHRPTLAYCNGRTVPVEEARVPLLDRGFLFGEAAYEALLVKEGALVAGRRHLQRLQRSAEGIGIDSDDLIDAVSRACSSLVRAFGAGDALLYLQVTGGVGPERDHLPPVPPPERGVYATIRPFDFADVAKRQASGVAVATVRDRRWACATFKTTQLLPNVLARRDADRREADEALLVDVEGRWIEGASSNILVVLPGNRIVTPPLTANILPGVTRDVLLEELRASSRYSVEERILPVFDACRAVEVALLSTTKLVMPVVRVDAHAVGDGRPGPVVADLNARLWRALAADMDR